MEQLLVRNLPDGTKSGLRQRAERNRRSVEAEVRSILVESLAARPKNLVDMLADNRPEADFAWEPERLNFETRQVF